MIEGSFNTEEQAKKDKEFFNLSIHMVPIWKDKGYFLYAEQALTKTPKKPFRQRIYELTLLNDSIIKIKFYNLKNETNWIEKWKSPVSFNALSKNDILIKEGCDILLKKINKNHYEGETNIGTCLSSIGGANYATSKVVVKNNKINLWFRGFNKDHKQVWGNAKKGYELVKVN